MKGEMVQRRTIQCMTALVSALAACCVSVTVAVPTSAADPIPDGDLFVPLPVVVPTASDWTPKFPYAFDSFRDSVTDADITAQREMCQWYEAQYDILRQQINRVQFNRIQPSGIDYDYTYNGVGQQVDIVTANIAQSVNFLAPRALALTQLRNNFGDTFFPLYQGESFFRLWQYLAAVNDGINAHQPDWFTGPSVQRMLSWGSDINRSHVCRS